MDAKLLALLRCPVTGLPLVEVSGGLAAPSGHVYPVSPEGIPFLVARLSADGAIQQKHYDKVAANYIESLTYAHTQEYSAYLDRCLSACIGDRSLGVTAEICCGRGEAVSWLGARMERVVGVDVSLSMLTAAVRAHGGPNRLFVQGDATQLPLADESFDSVVILGGIHHVNDRLRLFAEIHRILKPGGSFFWREPVSDFVLWRALRAVVYRLSPALDYATERPLLYEETIMPLERAGLRLAHWSTHGLFGFCLLMNSDVLVFNRFFRFIPGIRTITRAMSAADEAILRLPGLNRAGLIVVGAAVKA